MLAFLGYFGVYGFYAGVVDMVGAGWALAGSSLIAVGALVIAAAGIAMIQTRPPETDDPPLG